jgi:hypothetical protein
VEQRHEKHSVLCVVIGVSLTSSTAFARAGMGSWHVSTAALPLSVTGGAFGTSAATPGTNSLGTALFPTGGAVP